VSPAASPFTTYDPEAAWAARLDAARSLEREQRRTSDNRDASALLDLLSDGPEAVIRRMPAAAREALAMCDNDALSRVQLTEGLSRDPALVQGLLRTANSVALGARGPVLGIDQALDRIGVSGARAVVLASCVDGLLSHPGGEYNAMASDVWSHMVRTAPIARLVASSFDAHPDEALSVALLHDVGKLVIFDRISVLRASNRRAIALNPAFVHDVLQLLHEPLGALSALQWGMGDRAATAIGTHHRRYTTLAPDALSEVVYLAERVDNDMRRGEPADLASIWTEGRLTGSMQRAAGALEQVLGERQAA
jgi:HD-like signal output (HDOD) protein